MFDTKAFAAGLMQAVQEWINPTIKQIDERLLGIDAAIAELPAPVNGKDADPAEIARLVEVAVAAIPPAKDGASVTLEDVAPLIAEEVSKAFASLPVPQNGKDADQVDLEQLVETVVARIPVPKDGTSVTPEEIEPLVQEYVAKAVSAIPVPKDGESVPIEQVQRMVDEAISKAIAGVRMPKDGDPGRDAAHIEILPAIDVAKSYPRGTYAKHAGGLWRSYETTTELKGWECLVEGIAQLSIEQHPENARKFLVKLSTSGGRQEVKEFSMPVVLYRGIFKEGDVYEAGDSVTWGGSTWIALQDTASKPDSVDGTWRLAVKRGSPGKDGGPSK